MSATEIIVSEWPAPRGYANGRFGDGRLVHVGGQIGWNADGVLASASTPHETFVAQFGQALDNVIAVVRAAGGSPTDLASMTVFVTDMAAYRATRKELAAIWKLRLGKHFPAMALVAVTALFEPDAVVEIQAIAHLGVTP